MTNNPTIDGVSRSALECLVAIHDPRISDKATLYALEARWQSAAKEVRELLEAPVVERQEPFGVWRVPKGFPLQGMFLRWSDECDRHITELVASQTFDFTKLYTAPPQLAELQAEIERLESLRDHQAERVNFYIEKNAELQSAIERLKNNPLQNSINQLENIEASINARQRRIDAAISENCVEFGFEDRSVMVTQEAYSVFIAREKHYQSTIERQAAEIAELRSCLTSLRTAATNFKDYAESGWDHFPDVGIDQDKALADATAALNLGHPPHNPASTDCGTHPHNDGLEDYRGKP